jgi:hypothetical protein
LEVFGDPPEAGRQIELPEAINAETAFLKQPMDQTTKPAQANSPPGRFVDRVRPQTYARCDLPPADEGMI